MKKEKKIENESPPSPKFNLQISEKTKWLLIIAGMLIVGSLIYMGMLHWFVTSEIEWQYPIIASVVIILILLFYFYYYSSKLEVMIADHCNLSGNLTDDICKVKFNNKSKT